MWTTRGFCWWWSLCFLAVPPALAQDGSSTGDSLRFYTLEEIVVGGAAQESVVGLSTSRLFRVPLADVASAHGTVASDLLRTVPGLHTQTNSRGETLAYMRGGGERQTEYLLDGVPLNIPWDNRFDLGALPAALVGSISAVRSAAGPRYGTGGAGGVILLSSRAPALSSSILEMSGQAASGGTWQYDGLWGHRSERRSVVVSGSVLTRDGLPVASGADLPLDGDRDRRLNSDRTSASGFLRWQEGRVTVMALHAESEAGVMPEGHLTTAADAPRLWRYPLWRNSLVSAGGRWTPWLQSVAWVSRFQQHIDAFPDVEFDVAEERQEDLDVTAGTRLLGESTWRGVTLATMAQFVTSRHNRKERLLGPGEALLLDEDFREWNGVVGVDASGRVPSVSSMFSGVSVEWKSMPETGQKPGRDGFRAITGYITLERPLVSAWTLGVTAAREIRMPTMRELFGDALDRFLLNPGLDSEATYVTEVLLRGRIRGAHIGATAFRNRTFNTIDQENVTVEGERRRRRVNLEGSRVWGVEVTMSAPWTSRGLVIGGHGTWMRPAAFSPEGSTRLMERPEVLSQVFAQKTLGTRFRLGMRADYTGRAWARTGSDTVVALPRALLLHADVTYRRFVGSSTWFLDVSSGVKNAFDAVQMPQLGLPVAGRSAFLSVSLSR